MVSKGFLSRVILLLLCSVIFTCTVTFFLNSSSTFSFSSSSSSSSSLSSSPSSLSSHYYQLWSASVLETKSRESGQTFSELHQSDSDNKKEAIDKLLVSKLPPSTQLTNEQTYALVEATSNLALFYWDSWQNLSSSSESSRTSTCTSAVHFCHSIKLPSPFELRQTNRFWQQFDSNYLNSTVTLHLLNAYYDGRPETELLGPKVRLLGVTKEAPAALDKHRKWSCLLWFADLRSPVLVQASEYHNIFPQKWQPHVEAGTYHPALITCPLPVELQDRLPAAVSLVNAQSGRCSGLTGKNLPVVSNVLRVLHSKANPQNSTKKTPSSFGVCVQALRFATYEQSVRLVEWLEWMRLLGAEKVYLYVLGLTEHMRAVLNSYASEGLLDWREFTLPGEQPNLGPLYNLAAYHMFMHFWPQELIELNDCLYRNLDRHEYLAVIDIDEVILPQKEGVKDWSSLLRKLEESVGEEEFRRKAFYNSRQSHVCEAFEDPKSTEGQKIPPYLYTLRHRRRGRPLEFNKQNKCIVRPSHVFTLHNHFPIHCLNGSRSEPLKGCDGLTFDPEDSVVLHFRRNISNPQFAHRNWDCPVEERAMFAYAQELTERVRVKLADLFL